MPPGALTDSPHARFTALLARPEPWLALAPMQEVTDGAFWALVHRYGGADVYWTEYFRVHDGVDAGAADPRLRSTGMPPAGRSSRR